MGIRRVKGKTKRKEKKRGTKAFAYGMSYRRREIEGYMPASLGYRMGHDEGRENRAGMRAGYSGQWS